MSADPRDDLANFLRENVTDPEAVEELLTLIEDALTHTVKGRIPRAELKEETQRLASTAKAFAKALEFTLLRDLPEGNQTANELRFFLRNSKFLARGGDLADRDDAERAMEEARRFDRVAAPIIYNPQSILDAANAIAELAERLISSNVEKAVLARKGKPPNEARIGLGFELAGLWTWATGKRPTYSGAASIDKPGTLFGTFVVLVSALPGGNLIIDSDLPRFIREAASAWNEGGVKC